MIAERALSVPEVQFLLRLVNSRISSLQTILHDILVLCQRNAVFFCIVAPKKTVLFPFRCMGAVLDFFNYVLQRNGREKSKPLNVAEILTGTENPNYSDVCNASRQLCKTGMKTIINQISADNKLEQYKKDIEKWNKEKEKEIEELLPIEDLTFSQAVKYLKHLNTNSDKLKIIKNNLPNYSEKEIKGLSENPKDDIESICNSLFKNNKFLQGSNKIESVLSRMCGENEMEKLISSATDEKLSDILCETEGIKDVLKGISEKIAEIPKLNEELAMLRGKLYQEQMKFKYVLGERDDFKVKLSILEALFDEQDGFLESRKRKREDEGSLSDSQEDYEYSNSRCPMQ